MKTKLTLTVNKNIIAHAKRVAKERNISLSQLFEEIFEKDTKIIKTESQQAAERLLKLLSSAQPIENKEDKVELKSHVARKYA